MNNVISVWMTDSFELVTFGNGRMGEGGRESGDAGEEFKK